jgi:RasGEF domain/RasGEF N-terminal motif
MNFIATFLLTYRSFCTTDELISHLQKRYTLAPPEELTMEELEIWVEKKLKLVRLRVFNVLKTWVENYYYQEDYGVLESLRQFTITVIRDTLTFSAEQLERLINMRLEKDKQSEMKKMISNNNSIAPMPILPRNMKRVRLLDVDSLELARQLTIIDFKLYSAIRPIECLDKAWSRDDETGKTASNIKASILFCNQVTAWVSDSILSQHEAKKRAAILKHWVQVAERCRMLGNFNTCMAILSAFDNSAIGRLKRTWEVSSGASE